MTNQISSLYSIVIPARNEEETIGDVLRGVREMTDDLIVVDGHSTDRTIAIAGNTVARMVQEMLAIAQRDRPPKPVKIPSTDHLGPLDSERLGSVQL